MKMKKRVQAGAALALALVLSLTALPTVFAAGTTEAESKAAALKELGLFQGVSESDFALDRPATRAEATVMLIRTLGKEAAAQSGGGTHPFADVPAWADRYIGYAYENGLTKGTSATTFGIGDATMNMYLTFLLRALGYSDTAGDFTWNAPQLLARAVGILPEGVDTENFLRADVALVSWAALKADVKGGGQSLAEKLMVEKAFTPEAYARAVQLANEQQPSTVTVASAEALKTALSERTAKIISVQSPGTPVIIAGEWEIPQGVTVTVERGNDFYVEGTLINNGTLEIMGADAVVRADFINYSVLALQNGGKLVNNGRIELLAATLTDTEDRGPVGGQLRIFDGSLENNGSVFLKAGTVNTHGGMVAVIEGGFHNRGLVVVDGFQMDIAGAFTNESGAVVVNNSYISTEKGGSFTNVGTLSGNVVRE